jgi:hypothetical protein
MLDNRYEYRDGQLVSQRVAQVIQAIHEYCPDIEVQWVPQSQRDENTAAFRIIHNPPGGSPYVIFHVKDEADFHAGVLKRIIEGDQRHGKASIQAFEAAEAAAKAVARQRYMDQVEEANEIAASIFASNKSTYKVSKDLVVKDYLFGNHASKPKNF